MQPINHNHLYYFWLAAKDVSVTKAAQKLGLAQPTVSAQIRQLEASFGAALFNRRGRTMDLTEAGRLVYRYADEMFQIAAEIPAALAGRATGEVRTLYVGTSDFVPKPVTRQVLEPLIQEPKGTRLVCREWRIEELFAELDVFKLDLIIADRPHPDGSQGRAISQPVLESGLCIYARRKLALQLRPGFPRSLHGAPMYLPVRNTALRDSLERWFDANGIRPMVLSEFEDRELIKTFGAGGLAAFPGAAIIEKEVRRQFGVERVGWVRGVRETYYAIVAKRRLIHPAVQSMLTRANRNLLNAQTPKG